MYGDYLNMWLLHNIKTMQVYKVTHNPVLLLFVHQPDRVSGQFIATRLFNRLNKLASGILISFTISLGKFGGIPSTPGDLFSYIIFIFLDIVSGVTKNCPK